MPLYEYQCDACRHRFEVIQKFSDPLVEKCPSCGGTVHKLQSAPAIQFKGAGFYITDYAKKEYTEATKADSGSPAGSKEAGSKEGTKEGSQDKTEKSVTPAKSSSASDAAPSSSSTTSKDSSSTKGS